MQVRDAKPGDVGALADIFFRAVREGAAPAYDEDQRRVWAAERPSEAAWSKRLEGLMTLVAEEEGQITGFMSARASDGYIDLAFVLPEVRGTGVAALIYAVMENRLRALGVKRLHTQASHLARPFFERVGWSLLRANEVQRGGQVLQNWIMEKPLSAVHL